MDEKLKNLIRARDAKLGWIGLAILVCLFVACNRFIFPLLDNADSDVKRIFCEVLFGVVVGQVMLVIVWIVLSSHTFLNRIIFLIFATTTLFGAWLLGYSSQFPTDVGINFAQHEEAYFFIWIFPLMLVTAIPFIALRFFGWRVLGSIYESHPTRSSISTAGLMLTTGIVAAALAAIQMPMLVEMRQIDIWTGFGFCSAFAVGASQMIFFPATCLLLDRKRSFFVWSILTLSTVITAVFFGTMAMAQFRLMGMRMSNAHIPAVVIGSALLIFVLGISFIRMFGYRLMKAENPISKEPKYGTKAKPSE